MPQHHLSAGQLKLISPFMEDLLKQARLVFSGKEDFGSTRERRTSSFKGERGPQNWLKRQLSRQMSNKGPEQEAEYAAAVAAAAFAITSLESDDSDQRKPDVGQPFSLPRIISGIVDRITTAAEPDEESERIADEHQGEAKEMIPEKTIHPVPSMRRTPTMPKKRLSFAEELQEDSGVPSNYIEKTPTFDKEDFEGSKRMKPRVQHPNNFRHPLSLLHQQFHHLSSSLELDQNGNKDPWVGKQRQMQMYEKLNATIMEWEDKKKKKAKRKLETTEVRFQSKKDSCCYKIKKAILTKICLQESQNELEKKRTKALQKYQIEMERIRQIADGARAQAKEKRRNEEFKVKDKANKYRATGERPMPPLCSCL
ncbi:Remorin 4.1 [Bienertia sinuspersici]